MATYKTLENLVDAYIKKDSAKFIKTLQSEINKSKNKGHSRTSKNLRQLISKIPAKDSSMEGQSFGMKLNNTTQLYSKIFSTVLIEDLVLEKNVKERIKEFIIQWDKREDLLAHNVRPANKLILYGMPGTGKTQLAYALANKLDLPIVIVRLDELISSFLGKTGQNIREIFEIANQESVIILLDEVDTIAKHRDDNAELGELKRVVTVLLQNIDMFNTNSILVAATNHEGLLDSALWRRFDLRLHLDKPSTENRALIFEMFLNDFKNKLNYKLLGKISEGLTGSQIKDISDKVKRNAIINKHDMVELKDIVMYMLYSEGSDANVKETRHQVYQVAQILKDSGVKIMEISRILDIPHTTLRYNLK